MGGSYAEHGNLGQLLSVSWIMKTLRLTFAAVGEYDTALQISDVLHHRLTHRICSFASFLASQAEFAASITRRTDSLSFARHGAAPAYRTTAEMPVRCCNTASECCIMIFDLLSSLKYFPFLNRI
jgi:hypothetical protein